MTTLHLSLFDEFFSLPSLKRAFQEELDRDTAPGMDGLRANDLLAKIDQHLKQLHDTLQDGSYRPFPPVRIELPKKDGKTRPIGIFSIRDRIVQRAFLRGLMPLCEAIFLPCSHGYRPRLSAHTALRQLQQSIKKGSHWIVESDIADCFGSIPLAPILRTLRDLLPDPRFEGLVRKTLETGVLEGGCLRDAYFGLPQGSPLSPLLCNLYLHPFDQALTEAGFSLIRYADDFVILTESRERAEEAYRYAASTLKQRGFSLHPKKTRILALKEGFDFLGFSINESGIRPNKGALRGLQDRLKELASTHATQPKKRFDAFKHLLLSWRAYFANMEDFQPASDEIAVVIAHIALRSQQLPLARQMLASLHNALCEPFASHLQEAQKSLQILTPTRSSILFRPLQAIHPLRPAFPMMPMQRMTRPQTRRQKHPIRSILLRRYDGSSAAILSIPSPSLRSLMPSLPAMASLPLNT